MVHYVGENTRGAHIPMHNLTLAASGVGLEVAQGWKMAIRQALMPVPVTPQPSVGAASCPGKDHSEYITIRHLMHEHGLVIIDISIIYIISYENHKIDENC